jgi:molecular chaperone HscB
VTSYFHFFGLPDRLSIDTAALQRKYYELSRRFHPDRVARGTPEEQQEALSAAALLNDGYRVLRDPVQRAEYALAQHGLELGEQRSKDVPPELLEEVFELNLALEELRAGDDDALEPLRRARDHFVALQNQSDADIAAAFERHDRAEHESSRRAVLSGLRSILNRRRYLTNLIREVEKELAGR